jgi:hypothetical protein
MWIRTKTQPSWYIHELRRACYVSWVAAGDKTEAQNFPENCVQKWVEVLSDTTGVDLEAVRPLV